jgi:transcriptional regulator with XRE-family HTH domain
MKDTPLSESSQALEAMLVHLPARLTQVINAAGLSQTDFARKVGVSSGFVSDLTRGVKRPGIDILTAIHATFGVSIDWLLTGSGSMLGGGSIQVSLFQAIRLQVALAREAILESNPTARALLLLVREGQLCAAERDPVFRELLDTLRLRDEDIELVVELYNGHQWTADPVAQRQNILAAALAHFEARKPIDRMSTLKDASRPSTVVHQVISGVGHQVAGRDMKTSRRSK